MPSPRLLATSGVSCSLDPSEIVSQIKPVLIQVVVFLFFKSFKYIFCKRLSNLDPCLPPYPPTQQSSCIILQNMLFISFSDFLDILHVEVDCFEQKFTVSVSSLIPTRDNRAALWISQIARKNQVSRTLLLIAQGTRIGLK